MKVLTQKKYQDHIPSGFAFKLVCVDNKSSMATEVKVLLRNLFKQFLKSMNTVKKKKKKTFYQKFDHE